jgi:hypothetical protein
MLDNVKCLLMAPCRGNYTACFKCLPIGCRSLETQILLFMVRPVWGLCKDGCLCSCAVNRIKGLERGGGRINVVRFGRFEFK